MTSKNVFVFQRAPLYRADSMEYHGPAAGLDTGSDMVPPTPAFPISPPTPYGETLTHPCTHRHTYTLGIARVAPMCPWSGLELVLAMVCSL